MKRQFATPTLLVLVLSSALTSGCGPEAASEPRSQGGQRLLAATVTISFVAPMVDENGDLVVVKDNGATTVFRYESLGLGTVVLSGPNSYVVTHDHWSFLDDPAVEVRIYDASSSLVAYLSGEGFRQLVRYRDGAIMVFAAPPGLPNGLTVGDGEAVRPGSLVESIHHEPATGKLTVVNTRVEFLANYFGSPSLRLRNLDGEIVEPGNSGGGVVWNGRLVASTTATVLANESGPVPQRLAYTGAPSAESYAARLSVARVPDLYQVQSIASLGPRYP